MELELYGIYRVCLAVVAITEFERSTYTFKSEIDIAKEYIEVYEKAHPEVLIDEQENPN